MAKSKTEVNFMEHLKPLLPAGGDASELEAAAQTLAGLSPEDCDLLAAVQESPYRLITLEQFRRTVRIRLRLLRVFILLCAAAVFCAHFWGHRGGVPGARFPYYADLLTGALSALGISAAFICIRLTKMLRDDVLLHKMYTKATDEREALLWQKAGRQAFWVVVPGLVLAALAAGYWSATVCMTLLGAALFTAVTTKALRFYYMRKF